MTAAKPQYPDTPEFHEQVLAALEAGPKPRAPGPGVATDDLRDAYLGVLKLALCDLAAPRTMSVERTDHGLASHELRDLHLSMRSLGMDWPLYGLSMVGLNRLDDLERCVRSVVRDEVAGDLIEAGTWRGGASMLMRATLDTLGDDRTVWVADSYTGFREDLRFADLAAVDFLAVSLEEVKENFARFGLESGVEYLPGYFDETMPRLGKREWAICRLDGDSYEATRLCLETLYADLSVGGYVIIDDYWALDECRAAVDEFRASHGIEEPLEKVDWTCARWRRQTSVPAATTARKRVSPAESSKASTEVVRRPEHTPVPTVEELTLRRETAALRDRLQATEAALQRSRQATVARVGRWLRRRAQRS